jgi:hypothetical protein
MLSNRNEHPTAASQAVANVVAQVAAEEQAASTFAAYRTQAVMSWWGMQGQLSH